MSDSNFKTIRKQIRNVCQELLGPTLMEELKSKMYGELANEVRDRLTAVEKSVRETLEQIDQRSKDVQSYLVRAVTAPAPTAESTPAASNEPAEVGPTLINESDAAALEDLQTKAAE